MSVHAFKAYRGIGRVFAIILSAETRGMAHAPATLSTPDRWKSLCNILGPRISKKKHFVSPGIRTPASLSTLHTVQ